MSKPQVMDERTGQNKEFDLVKFLLGPIWDRRHHGPKKFLPSFWTTRRTEKARTVGKSSNRTNYGPNES